MLSELSAPEWSCVTILNVSAAFGLNGNRLSDSPFCTKNFTPLLFQIIGYKVGICTLHLMDV